METSKMETENRSNSTNWKMKRKIAILLGLVYSVGFLLFFAFAAETVELKSKKCMRILLAVILCEQFIFKTI